MKKLILLIPTLSLAFTISFSQVKYTSLGNFGIGTTSPATLLHLNDDSPQFNISSNGNQTSTIRFSESISNWYGFYIKYDGTPNELKIGSHSVSAMSTTYDKDILKIDRTYGRINLYPLATANYSKTFVSFNRNRYLENWVVYELTGTNPDAWTQTFCVQGRGHVYCSAVHETSDISLKENIKDVTNGIELVKQLRPVKYNFIAEAALPESERETDFGLIAQEVELIVPEAVSENSSGLKGINYREITVLLIDAVKQQAAEIDLLKTELSGLSESMKKSTSGLSDPSISEIEKSELFQNSPNPFNDATDIKYYIPQNSNMSSINIYDLNGKMLDSYEIKSEGDGKITIPGSMLDAGLYFYNLIVDGVIIDTKQMVLTK